jgi:threonine aldolase
MREDHDNAKKLASVVAATNGLSVVYPVETNIVVIKVDEGILGPTQGFIANLKSNGVLAGTVGPATVRMVTHLDIKSQDIGRVAEVLQTVARA